MGLRYGHTLTWDAKRDLYTELCSKNIVHSGKIWSEKHQTHFDFSSIIDISSLGVQCVERLQAKAERFGIVDVETGERRDFTKLEREDVLKRAVYGRYDGALHWSDDSKADGFVGEALSELYPDNVFVCDVHRGDEQVAHFVFKNGKPV